MPSRPLSKYILSSIFLIGSNFASSSDEFTYDVIDGGAEVTGCVGECPNDLVIPEEINGYSVTSIGNEAFDNNELTSAIIPSSVQNIGSNAFTGNQLTSIDIPNSITSMFSDAFSYNQLTSISVPSGITAIDVNTFSFNNLTNVTIPRNISTIGDFAFEGNPLASVNFDGNRPQISSAFLEIQFETIYYCAGTTGWPGQPIEGVTPQLDENCDSDNDGVKNAQDAFPFDPSETLDTDLDGIGNNADPDDDNDGVPDADDSEPLDSNIGIIEYATFDIDQSGSVDALSDGLIILRYLFDFRGDSLINNAISPDANRTSSSEIEEYLDSHIN